MLKTYLKLSLRQIGRNRIFSTINILGLGFSIGVCLVLWTYIRFETSYNSFFPGADKIYQLQSSLYSLEFWPQTGHDVVPALKRSVPGLKTVVRVHWDEAMISFKVKGEEKSISAPGAQHVDPGFFDLFRFEAVAGNTSGSLQAPYSIVLTKSLAKSLFSNPADAIGQTVHFKSDYVDADMNVTAVVSDPPANSTMSFTCVVNSEPIIQTQFYQDNPRWNNFVTFLEVEDNDRLPQIYNALPAFITEYSAGQKLSYQPEIYLQPLRDIHLSHEDPREGKDVQSIYLYLAISLIVLSIAWVNYINLATAKAMERAKEVGVRKAIGVSRRQLIGQFLVESMFMNVIALVIAVVLANILLPFLGGMTGKPISLDLLDQNWIFTLIGLLVVGTLASGIYPALVLSSFKAVEVIKGSGGDVGGLSLRQVLIVFQFSASLCLLIVTIAILRQVDFMQHADKGLKTDQVLVVQGPDDEPVDIRGRMQSFKNQLQQLPNVEKVSMSGVTPGGSFNLAVHMEVAGRSDFDFIPGENGMVVFSDMDIVETYGMKVVAGRNFDPLRRTDLGTVLVNEAAIGPFGLRTSAEAIGQKMIINSDTMEIIGVVKNFYWESLKVTHKPIAIYPFEFHARRTSLRIAGDIRATVSDVEKVYRELFPGNEFNYYFADDYYNEMYQADTEFGNIFMTFSGFAIGVACLGLFGLSIFVAQRRSKEISIRKVLGASINSILTLLSMQFGRLLMIATAIAIPVSWLSVNLLLERYPVRFDLTWWLFAVPAVALMVIALLSIIGQTYRAASVNPADKLRNG